MVLYITDFSKLTFVISSILSPPIFQSFSVMENLWFTQKSETIDNCSFLCLTELKLFQGRYWWMADSNISSLAWSLSANDKTLDEEKELFIQQILPSAYYMQST